MRFRQHSYAVSADIEGMFLQVVVIPQDQPSLHFMCTSTCATSSVQRIHRLVPTMTFNEQHVITAKCFRKPRKVSEAIFTWTITLSRARPLMKKPRKKAQDLVEKLYKSGFTLTQFVSNI